MAGNKDNCRKFSRAYCLYYLILIPFLLLFIVAYTSRATAITFVRILSAATLTIWIDVTNYPWPQVFKQGLSAVSRCSFIFDLSFYDQLYKFVLLIFEYISELAPFNVFYSIENVCVFVHCHQHFISCVMLCPWDISHSSIVQHFEWMHPSFCAI